MRHTSVRHSHRHTKGWDELVSLAARSRSLLSHWWTEGAFYVSCFSIRSELIAASIFHYVKDVCLSARAHACPRSDAARYHALNMLSLCVCVSPVLCFISHPYLWSSSYISPRSGSVCFWQNNWEGEEEERRRRKVKVNSRQIESRRNRSGT